MKLFKSAIFAGIAISIGGLAYLTMGKLFGPILFTFGLITVIHYKLALYTGTVGFTNLIGLNKEVCKNWIRIFTIIGGNIIGCSIVASLFHIGNFQTELIASEIVLSRISQPLVAVIVRAIGCGLIMSASVQFAREGRFLPLLFGVPLFIFCGFYHSIADTFYYSASLLQLNSRSILTLFLTYFGNYIGCSTYKIFE